MYLAWPRVFSHHRCADLWKRWSGADVWVDARQSAFDVGQYKIVLWSFAAVELCCGVSRDPEMRVFGAELHEVKVEFKCIALDLAVGAYLYRVSVDISCTPPPILLHLGVLYSDVPAFGRRPM